VAAPPNSNRGLLIAIIALSAVLLLAIGLIIGLALTRDSTDNIVTSSPSGTSAPAGTSSSTSTTSTTIATTTSTSTTTSSSTSTTTTTRLAPASTTTTAAGGLTQSCTSDFAHATIRYPTGWYTSTGSEVDCQLFDPEPIVVPVQSEAPFTAVYVGYRDLPLASAVAEERSPGYVTIESEVPTTLGGRSAVCLTMFSNGEGLLDAGTRLYVCLVDFAGNTLIVGSNRPPGEPDLGYDPIVRAMASAATSL